MNENYSYEEIYGITEVLYLICKLEGTSKEKIPSEFILFLQENYDKDIYCTLQINKYNIDNISTNGKYLLKIVDFYINS